MILIGYISYIDLYVQSSYMWTSRLSSNPIGNIYIYVYIYIYIYIYNYLKKGEILPNISPQMSTSITEPGLARKVTAAEINIWTFLILCSSGF